LQIYESKLVPLAAKELEERTKVIEFKKKLKLKGNYYLRNLAQKLQHSHFEFVTRIR